MNQHELSPRSHQVSWVLAVVNFLASLTATERQAFMTVAAERAFPRGSKPVREGDRPEYVMVIIDGWAQISVRESGRDRVITERGPGQLIGEVGALRVSVRPVTVTVLERIRALVLTTEDFASYLSAHQRVLDLVEDQIDDRLTREPGRWNGQAAIVPAGAYPLAGENCTVIMTDVVGFGAHDRSDRDRGVVRSGHLDMMRRSLGYLWGKSVSTDQGDGLLIVIPPATPTIIALERLHRELPGELARHNHTHDESARIRLRVAANVGPVANDTVGMTGKTIIQAARLLDAPVLKEAMAAAGTSLGIIVSQFVYDTAIRSGQGWADPNSYRAVEAHVKETHVPAWIRLFDESPAEPVG